jgi:predicted amidohydrolase YtcJ
MTLDPGQTGTAVWWQDGVIRAVGPVEELERRVPSRVPRYDYPDALVTPGFVDGHAHFGHWAATRHRIQLQGAATRAEALERIGQGPHDQGWLRGHGWDANRWEAPPERGVLDDLTVSPAFFESLDVHAGWANSVALSLAGISRDTPDPPGGRIVRDAAGEPTGLLLERAVELVTRQLPAPDPQRLLQQIQEAQGLAHRMGITGIHDVEGPEVLLAFRTMETRQLLRLRVLFHPPVAELPKLLRHGSRSGSGSARLRLGGVKLFLDGTLGSRTAWMLGPYEDGGDAGMPLAPEFEVAHAMETAARGGLACVVHAIGDAAVRQAIDLLSRLPGTALPNRIEHLQCVHPADLRRAAQAGIIASMQPAHLPADVALAETRWGGRAAGAYAFRDLLAAGTTLAFGSDVPVATMDPRVGVVAAMTRCPADGSFPRGWYPSQRLGFEQTVEAYTTGNAIAAAAQVRSGRLAPGCDADLVAWRVDPAIDRDQAAAFAEARAVLTVVGGEPVWRDPS